MQKLCIGFPHSGITGYFGSYHLTDAYRRLARPSSPLIAKASTVHTYSLNLATHKCPFWVAVSLEFRLFFYLASR
jgi:hypothetical protein